MYDFRFKVDPEYLQLFGRATYSFALYEWAMIWTLEKLEPGSLGKCEKLTANGIGKLFGEVLTRSVNKIPSDWYQLLNEVQQRFSQLAKGRDQLIHAHPGTAPNGAQQLFYSGRHGQTEWPLQRVEQIAREFEIAAIEANDLFHTYWPNS